MLKVTPNERKLNPNTGEKSLETIQLTLQNPKCLEMEHQMPGSGEEDDCKIRRIIQKFV